MDDDLRQSLGVSFDVPDDEPEPVAPVKPARVKRPSNGLILGMTASQRLVLASLLLVLTFILGSLFLVLADKVAIAL
jgi:hypothetical protein